MLEDDLFQDDLNHFVWAAGHRYGTKNSCSNAWRYSVGGRMKTKVGSKERGESPGSSEHTLLNLDHQPSNATRLNKNSSFHT